MAKRSTGVGSKRNKKTRPHKTKKRLEAKRELLALKASKHRKHNRK